MRCWAIHLATGGANFRATAVSPRLQGPAVLRDFVVFRGQPALAAGKNSGLELYYSRDDAGAGTGQAISPPPTGNPIFEAFGDPTQDDKFQTVNTLSPHGPLTSSALSYHWDLRYVIPGGEWFLKASIVSANSVTVTDYGLALTLFEDVDPELLPDLL